AFWPDITRQVSGFVRQMGDMEGLELISPGHNVQLTPYGTFTRSQSLDLGVLSEHMAEDRRVGLDAKVVLGTAVTVDATVNPDFSEVESNEPLIGTNQRFEVFFPEKRPFFMENAAMFETPISVFFSRRIADPAVGMRMTARSAGWAIGALGAIDRTFAPPESAGLLRGGAAVGVVRAERRFGDQSKLAALVTNRQEGQSWNRVLSVDGGLHLGPTWSLSAQAVRSENQ